MTKSIISFIFLPLIICGCSSLDKTPKNTTIIPNSVISQMPIKPQFNCSSSNCNGNDNKQNQILSNYKKVVTNIITSNWDVPTNSAGRQSFAEFDIDKNGNISNITIHSKDRAFNNSLKTALEKSSPLPVPPLSYYEQLKHPKILFSAQ